METFELRYFLGVAKEQNIHRASEALRISPASLSKAVTRLEAELGVSLFSRKGRNIQLTPEGQLLQTRASEIIHLEESAKLTISGQKGSIHVGMTGPEILLSRFALEISATLRKKFPLSTYELQPSDDESALQRVLRGESHLAIVTAQIPPGLHARHLAETTFQTCVGAGHPLFALAKAKKPVPIENVLEHPFVSPGRSFFGTMRSKQSSDGWRDDKFPRQVQYVASSVKLIEELVVQGYALAYLPDYFVRTLKVLSLNISGCPYSCVQKIQLVTRNPEEVSWIHRLF